MTGQTEDTRTSAQRALDAAELMERTGCGVGEASAKHHVVRTQVYRVRKALGTAVPELVDAVRAGLVQASTAERLAALDPDGQRRALRRAAPAKGAPVGERVGLGDRLRMTKQTQARTSGLGVLPVILADWQEHAHVIGSLDPDVLSAFLADLKRARRSAGALIHLIERQTER